MIIGVLSDTHIPVRASRLPEPVVRALRKVDLILHAGDFISLRVYEELQHLGRVEAVAGNMDDAEIAKFLPPLKEISLGGLTIGLTHGGGGCSDLPLRVRARFRQDVDCVVFGHSHMPYNERDGKTLLFNPGSTAFRPNQSYGILTVERGEISGDIVYF